MSSNGYGFNFPVSFDQKFEHDLDSNVYIKEYVDVRKYVFSDANVDGNTGISNAKADAIGPNSIAETINTTWAIYGQGSGAYGSSVSATDVDYYYAYEDVARASNRTCLADISVT